ncbi:type-F conjugative transfer system pilin assembly protein TrbC [Comamonadaceae bacterium G21597-S1]|nr:type-F conjugative transfer system pilin assembly protein TrbC [Comamonadaceae bacterium G21597-S1]
MLRRSLRLLPLMVVLLLPLHGLRAQGPADISDADLERVRREQPVITEQDIEQARQRNTMPAEAALEGIARRGPINIDALPRPAQGSVAPGIDLEALGRGFASSAPAPGPLFGPASAPALMVFVSLSMPQPTLRKLVDQAARAQATLILRGLVDNSIRTTITQVQALIGQADVAMQIDPQAFDRFAIEQVPSFVLVRDGTRPTSCASGVCAPPDTFVKLTGDVSVDYALQAMRQRAPEQSRDAAPFLRRLRAR